MDVRNSRRKYERSNLEQPIELRFVDLFMIIIVALISLVLLVGVIVPDVEPPVDPPSCLKEKSTPHIMTHSFPVAVLKSHYLVRLAVMGGTAPYRWQIISGRLPRGLSLSEEGSIQGVPVEAGTAKFALKVVDTKGHSDQKLLSIEIRDLGEGGNEVEGHRMHIVGPVVILPDAENGQFYDIQLRADGGRPPYRWYSRPGFLPEGLHLHPNGRLSGPAEIQSPFKTPIDEFSMLFKDTDECHRIIRERTTWEFDLVLRDANGKITHYRMQLHIKFRMSLYKQAILNDFYPDVTPWKKWVGRILKCLVLSLYIFYGLIILLIIGVPAIMLLKWILEQTPLGACFKPTYLILLGYDEQVVQGRRSFFRCRTKQTGEEETHQISGFLAPFVITVQEFMLKLINGIKILKDFISNLVNSIKRYKNFRQQKKTRKKYVFGDTQETLGRMNGGRPKKSNVGEWTTNETEEDALPQGAKIDELEQHIKEKNYTDTVEEYYKTYPQKNITDEGYKETRLEKLNRDVGLSIAAEAAREDGGISLQDKEAERNKSELTQSDTATTIQSANILDQKNEESYGPGFEQRGGESIHTVDEGNESEGIQEVDEDVNNWRPERENLDECTTDETEGVELSQGAPVNLEPESEDSNDANFEDDDDTYLKENEVDEVFKETMFEKLNWDAGISSDTDATEVDIGTFPQEQKASGNEDEYTTIDDTTSDKVENLQVQLSQEKDGEGVEQMEGEPILTVDEEEGLENAKGPYRSLNGVTLEKNSEKRSNTIETGEDEFLQGTIVEELEQESGESDDADPEEEDEETHPQENKTSEVYKEDRFEKRNWEEGSYGDISAKKAGIGTSPQEQEAKGNGVEYIPINKTTLDQTENMYKQQHQEEDKPGIDKIGGELTHVEDEVERLGDTKGWSESLIEERAGESSKVDYTISETGRNEILQKEIVEKLEQDSAKVPESAKTILDSEQKSEYLLNSVGPGIKKTTPTEKPARVITRYTDISCPRRVWVETPRISIVILLTVKPSNLSEVKPIDIKVKEEYPVRLRIEAHSFDILNGPEQEIPILPGKDSMPVVFYLQPRLVGNTDIIINFFQTGNPVGTVCVPVEVTENEISVINETIPGKNLHLGIQVQPPDLMLFISFNRFQEQLTFTLMRVGEVGRTFKPISLQAKPENYAILLYERLTGLNQGMDTTAKAVLNIHRVLPPDDVDRRIKKLGQRLWRDLIPDDLKLVYDNEREQWQKKTLLIISDEPYLPWELVWPYSPGSRKWEDEGPWCETINLTRWLRRDAQGNGNEAPLPNLQLSPIAGIAPNDSGLTAAQKEIELIKALMKRYGIEDISPDDSGWSTVVNLLEHSCYNWLHIAAHGYFSPDSPDSGSEIFLQNYDTITTEIFIGPEIEEHINRQRPGFFFNACHSGRQGMGITGLGGWVNRLLSAGASLFIAPQWTISDKNALNFAFSFYCNLLNKQENNERLTVSEAVRRCRKAAKSKGDLTWLAYSVYAHPNARVILQDRLSIGTGAGEADIGTSLQGQEAEGNEDEYTPIDDTSSDQVENLQVQLSQKKDGEGVEQMEGEPILTVDEEEGLENATGPYRSLNGVTLEKNSEKRSNTIETVEDELLQGTIVEELEEESGESNNNDIEEEDEETYQHGNDAEGAFGEDSSGELRGKGKERGSSVTNSVDVDIHTISQEQEGEGNEQEDTQSTKETPNQTEEIQEQQLQEEDGPGVEPTRGDPPQTADKVDVIKETQSIYGGGPELECATTEVESKINEKGKRNKVQLEDGLIIEYGGAFLILPFLEALKLDEIAERLGGQQMLGSWLDNSLDEFLRRLLGLRRHRKSADERDIRFDVVLGRGNNEPFQYHTFGRLVDKIIYEKPIKLSEWYKEDFRSISIPLVMSMAVTRAQEFLLKGSGIASLVKTRADAIRIIQRILRRRAEIKLVDGKLLVRVKHFRSRKIQKAAELLCKAMNARNPHTLDCLRFPVFYIVSED